MPTLYGLLILKPIHVRVLYLSEVKKTAVIKIQHNNKIIIILHVHQRSPQNLAIIEECDQHGLWRHFFWTIVILFFSVEDERSFGYNCLISQSSKLHSVGIHTAKEFYNCFRGYVWQRLYLYMCDYIPSCKLLPTFHHTRFHQKSINM